MEFKEGDLVKLKSGEGPVMTIEKTGKGIMFCGWESNGVKKTGMYPPESLVKAE